MIVPAMPGIVPGTQGDAAVWWCAATPFRGAARHGIPNTGTAHQAGAETRGIPAPPCQPTRPGMRLPRGRASQAAQVAEPLRFGQLLDALAAGWPSRRLNQESSLKHLLITAIRHKRENPHETAPNSPADSRPLRAFSARHQVEVTTHA